MRYSLCHDPLGGVQCNYVLLLTLHDARNARTRSHDFPLKAEEAHSSSLTLRYNNVVALPSKTGRDLVVTTALNVLTQVTLVSSRHPNPLKSLLGNTKDPAASGNPRANS
ncbi:hypothetical protein ACLOJK_004677 [Asimina triloba]